MSFAAKAFALGATSLFAIALANTARAGDRCGELKSFTFPGTEITITRTEEVAAGPPPPSPIPGPPINTSLPAHCLVEGVINPRKGTSTSGIGFAVALPENWSGQFLFQGGGGLDGALSPPIGANAAGVTPALARGMAVASTDSGHQSKGGFDASFFGDQQATLDFEYGSIGKVTEIAKAIITAYYSKPAAHSYFAGCSMGGREAMVAAQRFPLEFDGAISGDPAMRVGFSGIGDRWVRAALLAAAPKDDKGNPASAPFSDSDKKLVISKLLEACDDKDGLKDGMIFNRKACKFEPKTLQCTGAKADTCLSPEQVGALDKAFAGPKGSDGRQIYPGFFYDTGISAKGFIGGLLEVGPGPADPSLPAETLDFDKEAAEAVASPAAQIGDTANWTNMSTFSARGGKLIFYHGASDPWFSAEDTILYYERMEAANGGDKAVRNWSRAFLVPGMGHCGGGDTTLDQFDLLTALTTWVEKGKAPESVVATGKALPGRSRPLCAYPKHAQYKGSGNKEDAKNFNCIN
jgi:feruloyl esterase